MTGLRFRPLGNVGVVLLQLMIGVMNFTAGLILMTYYALNVDATSGQVRSLTTLAQISLLVFIFGLLSLMMSIIASAPLFSTQVEPLPPQPQFSQVRWQPAQEPPYVSTRRYVTQRSRSMVQEAETWSEAVCPGCGREVSVQDRFCDACGIELGELAPSRASVR